VKCERIGCENEASVVPTLVVWAKGTPVDERHDDNAARLLFDVPTCTECAAKLDVSDFCDETKWASSTSDSLAKVWCHQTRTPRS